MVGWRQDKLLRRLRLAPVSTAAVVTARIVISVAIGVVQLFVFLAIVTTPYFGLRLAASWWMAIPVVICGTLAFMSIGLLVGALAKTQQAATSIANLIILPMASWAARSSRWTSRPAGCARSRTSCRCATW